MKVDTRSMLHVMLQGMLRAAILTFAFSAAARAEIADAADFSNHGLRAKIEYCQNCHGLAGQGFRGFFPIPRLAGQRPEYLENQFRAFLSRRRVGLVMYGVLRSVDPSMRPAIARYFSKLDPKPLGGGPRELVALGRSIYEDGIPESNVPACMACHGEAAKGHGEIPRLAGQLDDYVVNKLVNWTRERGQDRAEHDMAAIMVPTARNLTRSQMAAVAAYLSHRQ